MRWVLFRDQDVETQAVCLTGLGFFPSQTRWKNDFFVYYCELMRSSLVCLHTDPCFQSEPGAQFGRKPPFMCRPDETRSQVFSLLLLGFDSLVPEQRRAALRLQTRTVYRLGKHRAPPARSAGAANTPAAPSIPPSADRLPPGFRFLRLLQRRVARTRPRPAAASRCSGHGGSDLRPH